MPLAGAHDDGPRPKVAAHCHYVAVCVSRSRRERERAGNRRSAAHTRIFAGIVEVSTPKHPNNRSAGSRPRAILMETAARLSIARLTR